MKQKSYAHSLSLDAFFIHFLEMGKLFNSMFLLSLFFETTLLSSCLNSNFSCVEGEKQALLKLKHSFQKPSNDSIHYYFDHSYWNPSHVLFSWKGQNCCVWKGVSCDENTGHVVKLKLRADWTNFLVAPEVNSCLLDLRYLEYLDLSGNYFINSVIPQFFGLMKHLRYLNISNAGFYGSTPRNIGNLTSLQVLDLSGNGFFSDDDVQWISGLASLQHLRMDDIFLEEAQNLFQVLNMLHSLKSLSLQGCYLDNYHLSRVQINSTLGSSLQYLDLGYNKFGGLVPSTLQNMTSLKFLDLSFNSLNSSLPKWFGNFKILVHLNLSSNRLSSIENGLFSILGGMCHLKWLDLSDNQLRGENFGHYRNFSGCLGHDLESLSLELGGISGQISNWVGMLKNLKYLSFSYSHLYGTIPDSVGQLSNLEALNLSHSHLYGTIPESLGLLSKLKTSDISHNQLTGTIRESLGQLSNLETLNLNYNSLEGVVSEEHFATLSKLKMLPICKSNRLTIKINSSWVPPFQLKHINLESCKFFGTQFPQWLQTQLQATTLVLSNTSILGTLPKWIKDMNLYELDLSHNQITGNLPIFPSKLKHLDLSHNNITGNLPKFPSKLNHLDLSNNFLSGTLTNMMKDNMFPELQVFNLSNNLVNGSIPNSFCHMKTLKVLNLWKNMLSGDIPDCWTEYQGLEILDLSSNNLSGSIPNSFGSLSLASLHLGNNNLSGEIPLALNNCPRLFILDLGENALSGPIPEWLGELSFLSVLRLRQNKLNGSIPSQLCQSSLQILDLADNNLQGTVTHCFGKFGTFFYSLDNMLEENEQHLKEFMKGIYLEYTKTLKYLVSIDLSRNELSGPIPEELTLATALVSLNLSSNRLSGQIPKKIGDLVWLESLDLSSNDLSGTIPESMSALTKLSYLSLSYNNLCGKIPTGNQLQTLVDPSIYAGNTLLCGTPLPKKCWDAKPQPQPGIKATDKHNSTEKMWFYIVIMSGYATGFWGVFGVLIFKKSWRHAYFSVVERCRDWVLAVSELKMASLKNMIKGNSSARRAE